MIKFLPYPVLSLIIGLFAILILSPSSVSASTTYFYDDFEDDDFSDWTVGRNPCGSNWQIVNRNGSKKLGIAINNNNLCVTEIYPTNWSVPSNDYLLETDMDFVSGTDKNLAFRYTDSTSWYDLHFQTESTRTKVILQRVLNSGTYSNVVYVNGMTNGNTYHLGVKIVGETIKIYVDGNIIIDYPDAGGRFPTGRIALQASVGGDQISEVYFDNVKVSSIDAPVEPVVVIPGMMGSWCKDAIISGGACQSAWTALPEPLDPYDSLLASLQSASDIGEGNVYMWYYDWRKPINTLSSEFSNYIDNTVLSGRPTGTKVRIVGHSFGGLVGTQYTENNPSKVSKLITTGSPHKGAVQSYGAWEGGELWGFSAWEKLALQLLLASRKGSFSSVKETIQTEIPSLLDALPTFDYLVDSSNSSIAESSLSQRNTQLPSQFTGLSNIASFLTTITGLESNSNDTLSSIKVKSRDWISQALGIWEDGAPDIFLYSPDGDLSVLRTSGRYDSASSKPEVAATHVGLISENSGIQEILTALGSSGSAIISDPALDDSKDHALFFVHSPATLSVQFNGQTVQGADGMVVLQDVSAGDATATLTGTGNGDYRLDVIQETPTTNSETTYSGSISTGQIKTLPIRVDPPSGNQNPLQDPQGDLYLTFANGKMKDMSAILTQATQSRSTKLLQSNVNQIQNMMNRALLQINTPSLAMKTTESALLLHHQLRDQINLLEFQRQLNSQTAQKLRNPSHDVIEQLQAAYGVLAIRAGQRYAAASFAASQSLVSRLRTQVDLKAQSATKGMIPGAIATQASQNDTSTGGSSINSNPPLAYINYLSSRLYLNEALKILK